MVNKAFTVTDVVSITVMGGIKSIQSDAENIANFLLFV